MADMTPDSGLDDLEFHLENMEDGPMSRQCSGCSVSFSDVVDIQEIDQLSDVDDLCILEAPAPEAEAAATFGVVGSCSTERPGENTSQSYANSPDEDRHTIEDLHHLLASAESKRANRSATPRVSATGGYDTLDQLLPKRSNLWQRRMSKCQSSPIQSTNSAALPPRSRSQSH